MRKLFIFVVTVMTFAACTNSQAPAAEKQSTSTTAPVALTDSASKVAELSFIDGCMENSKLTLGEPKAFTFCKCMYSQIHAKYPNIDSAGMASLDTAVVARMAAACR